MKKRELKRKITEAYRAQTPDLRSDILASCEQEAQEPRRLPSQARKQPGFNLAFKRVAAVALCLMLFISGLSVGLFIPSSEQVELPAAADAETFIYLDVNPSIELRMDKDSKILECIATNDDAMAIIAGLKLEGVDMNTALTAIVGSMYVNGYLSENSNSILVSIDTRDENKTDTLLTSITDKINTVFEKSRLECSIIAQSVKVSDELKQRALENGISVGKMHLVEKMVGAIDELGNDDAPKLADMSIKELNLIYSTRPDKGDKEDLFDKDISHGEIGGFMKQDDALASLLTSIGKDITGIEHYEVKISLEYGNGFPRIVYRLIIKFKHDDAIYEFKVGCENGEIIKSDVRIPSNDDPKDEDGDEKKHPILDGILDYIDKNGDESVHDGSEKSGAQEGLQEHEAHP